MLGNSGVAAAQPEQAMVDRRLSSGTSASLDTTSRPRAGMASSPSGPLVTGSTWVNAGRVGLARS